MSNRRLLILPSAFLLLLLSPPGQAVDDPLTQPAPERPSVALVLGGGGAHAVAHLGVLRELERQRIPIDLIVGNGFGGLIGGLYASGMTVDEIEELLTETDWLDIFNPDTKREDLSFRRKQDDDDFLIKYRVGIKDGQAQLPTALIPNDKLGFLLQKVTAGTKGVTSFDDLPVPFRAMAMDLVTGELVALDSGGLDRAILATLTPPGTLPPVKIDERVFVSGALLNNLPVDAARDQGADIIIVVDVGVFTVEANDLNSVFAVVGQVAHLAQQENSRRSITQMRTTDILISPQVGPYAETDFSAIKARIEPGESAVAAAAPRLAALSLSDGDFEAMVDRRNRRKTSVPVIQAVRLSNQSNISDDVIRAQIHQPLDAPLDKGMLEEDLRAVYGLGAFSTVEFQLLEEAAGKTLVIHTIEDAAARKFWRFGVSLEDDFEGNNSYTGSASFTWTQINRLNAEWRSVMRIGDQQELSTEFFQPVVASGDWFVSTSVGYIERNVNVFEEEQIISQARVDEIIGNVSVGRMIGNVGQVSVGLLRGRGESRINIGTDAPSLEFDLGGMTAAALFDSYDNIFFPKRGGTAALVWQGQRESMGSSVDVDILLGRASIVKSRGTHSLLMGFSVQSQLNEVDGVENLLSTGGLFNLSGFARDSLSGRHTGVARGIYYRQIRSNPLRGFLEASLYLGGSVEVGGAWQNSDDISLSNSIFAGSLFIGMDTFIGPGILGRWPGRGRPLGAVPVHRPAELAAHFS